MERLMKAFVLEAPGKFCIQEVPIPKPKKGEVSVRMKACGICGSDIRRIMDTGAYRHPLIPGHEFAGEIAAVGEGVNERLIGISVAVYPLIPCYHCRWCNEGSFHLCDSYDYLGSRSDGGFAEYVCVPKDNLVAIPDNVSFDHAALSEPASVALHGLKRVGLKRGESVVVFGAGPIGLMLCQMAKLFGASQVFVVDIVPKKLKLAQRYRWATPIDASKMPPTQILREHLPDGADVVIDAAGAPAVLSQAIAVTRKHGKLLLLGNPHGDVMLSQKRLWLILRHELTVVGTWNSLFHDDWRQVLEWMSLKALKIEPLISHRIALEELPEIIRKMHDGGIVYEKVLVVM